jgi:hypothetical protein
VPLLSTPASSHPIASRRVAARTLSLEQIILIGEWVILLAAVAYIGGRALPRAWHRLNTDFPNYYVTARLLREDYRTDRIYEWIWLQRQKDRMGIRPADQPVVGFIPHTPFSALLIWPLTHWPPLTAKRIWIVCNLVSVLTVGVLLRSLTQLPWRRIALLICVSIPLLRNLEYGQYYIVLLLVITAALWLYLRDRRFSAGVLMGIAGGLKLFPALFVFYFARKRDLRAIGGVAAGALASVAASVWAFGLTLHHTYFTQVLPWALRGEANDPYNLASGSLSSLLHRLLIREPEWNPHPVIHGPGEFAVLHPLLQMLILAPAIYLVTRSSEDSRRVQLEWSTFLVALLAISTLPASYHFTLLILPVCILVAAFLQERQHVRLALLLLLYFGVCFPNWPRSTAIGWWVLLGVPRLYLILLLCVLCYWTLARSYSAEAESQRERWIWAAALSGVLGVQIAATLYHQRGVYQDRASGLSTSPELLLKTEPVVRGDGEVGFIAMRSDGYGAGSIGSSGIHLRPSWKDQLSQTVAGPTCWIEEAGRSQQIIRTGPKEEATRIEVDDAEYPVASQDGKWLAYLRSTKGRSALWVRTLNDPNHAKTLITPPSFDVDEMTFLPDGSLIFAAANDGGPSALYQAANDGSIHALNMVGTRYPSASPNGRWLVYSRLHRGVWNLWLRDMQTGVSDRLTDADCNDISPAWETDSKTIIYASDCGRALWSTALYRKRLLP